MMQSPNTMIDELGRRGEPMPGRSWPGWWSRLWRDTAYNATSLALVVPAFVLAVTGLSAGVSLVIVWVGVPVLVLTAHVARGFASIERFRIRGLLATDCATPRYLEAGRNDGGVRRLVQPLRDPQSWLDIVWSVVGFVTGLTVFVVTFAWWTIILSGLTYPFWEQFIDYGLDANQTLASLVGLGSSRQAEIWLRLGIGVFALVTLPVVMRGCALLHSSLARVLLSSRAELQRQVVSIEGGRDAARLAEADSLRRLERDIHDGPQQRLVRLSMDLGRVRKQLDNDPATARRTLDEALVQARETVDELRSLSHGIAPPILVDRGLAVALAGLAARSSLPLESRIEVADDLPPHVETAVYFLVSEALTNVAKHSGATHAGLSVEQTGDRVLVEVTDNGRGGAHASKGHGLAGLEQRMHAVSGTLDIASPDGGPTTIRAEIACGSS
jgi:signal transduction histidine kinase